MKKLLIIFLALIPVAAFGQDFKPLAPVDVPDFPGNVIQVTEREHLHGGTYYTAFHALGYRSISASLGVPAAFDIICRLPDASIPAHATVKLLIGGEEYTKQADYYEESAYISINGIHVKHIAVSGLQGLTFLDNGDIIHKQDFNAIEQELWRRTAEELIKTVEKFGILDF